MPSNRDTAGESFNNTYHNGTLVGNWLEDRLQRSSNNNNNAVNAAAHDDGLLEDPRITRGRNASHVRQDLMHSTYDVDYSHKVSDSGEPETTQHPQSVLQASTAGSSMRGMSAGSKNGLHRALLFSKDPVADPAAMLPVSTNTDTYGAFCRDAVTADEGDGGATEGEGGGVARRLRESRSGTANRTAERDLYESVTNAKARQSAAPGNATAAGTTRPRGAAAASASATAFASVRSNATGFASLAAPAVGSRGGAEEDESDVRWCTSKQAADVPVEHYVFQRRLPPVWM